MTICDAFEKLSVGNVGNVGKILFDGSKFANEGKSKPKGGGGGRKSSDRVLMDGGNKFSKSKLGAGGKLFKFVYFEGLDKG